MSMEDKAQELELAEWERNNRAPITPEPKRYKPGESGYGPEICAECDDDMPPQRREYGYHICARCKSDRERRGR